jgi:hypothetical protein
MKKDSFEVRLRRATEAILEAENLTDGLQDAEAEALLNWGLARVEGAVQDSADLDSAAAKPHISNGVVTVRQMMRRINNLIAGRVDIEEDDELADGLRALLQAAPNLPRSAEYLDRRNSGRAASKGALNRAADLEEAVCEIAEQRYKLSDGQMLRKVLALIDAAANTHANSRTG